MTKIMVVYAPETTAAPAGQDKKRALDEARDEIGRQETIIETLERNLKPFKEELQNKVPRTHEENRQLDTFFRRLGELADARRELRRGFLNKIAEIRDIEGAVNKLNDITKQMVEESNKIKSRQSALDAVTTILTYINKTTDMIKK